MLQIAILRHFQKLSDRACNIIIVVGLEVRETSFLRESVEGDCNLLVSLSVCFLDRLV